LVFQVDLAWDGLTFVVCVAIVLYLYRLRVLFGHSQVGASYSYYLAGAAVLAFAFVVRIIFDLAEITAASYDLSVRDPAIIVALVLIVLGLRKSAKFWAGPSK
jgi:hypothetical protein